MKNGKFFYFERKFRQLAKLKETNNKENAPTFKLIYQAVCLSNKMLKVFNSWKKERRKACKKGENKGKNVNLTKKMGILINFLQKYFAGIKNTHTFAPQKNGESITNE